jgi:Putative zinc-finger
VNTRPGGPTRAEPDEDPFLDYDAAYVFGALAPDDRVAYERHLQHCADCRAAVAAMAGVPGLLSRVPLDLVIGTDDATPVPDTLLPRLVAEAARERTRSRWRVGTAMALAAACVLGLLAALLVNQHTGRSVADRAGSGSSTSSSTGSVAPGTTPGTTPTAPTTTAGGPELKMAPVRGVGVSASVQIQSVLWGTRITLKCQEAANRKLPYAGLYYLVVVGRDSSRHFVADWNSLAGRTVRVEGDTGLQRAEIASLQLVDTDRDVVLTLAL